MFHKEYLIKLNNTFVYCKSHFKTENTRAQKEENKRSKYTQLLLHCRTWIQIQYISLYGQSQSELGLLISPLFVL